jgi:hypothetical protein
MMPQKQPKAIRATPLVAWLDRMRPSSAARTPMMIRPVIAHRTIAQVVPGGAWAAR